MTFIQPDGARLPDRDRPAVGGFAISFHRAVLRRREAALLALVLGLTTSTATAATIVADGVRCSLAEAITAANTNAAVRRCPAGDDRNDGGDIIALTADVTLTTVDNRDTHQCPNGLPAVTSRIRINGNRHTIARADSLGTPRFRILDSAAGILTLFELTVSNGFLETTFERCQGAGINGTVTMIDSTVSGNRIFGGDGGGINGVATLINSSVVNNSIAVGLGGGINGTATLTNSIVSGNSSGTSIPTNARLAFRAQAPAPPDDMTNGGGGIAGSVTLIRSIISNNVAGDAGSASGGGLKINGTATIIDSSISDNLVASGQSVGGGIHLHRGTLTLVNSTVSGNRAFGDGIGSALGCSGIGIYSSATGFPGGTVTLIHSTVSDNSSNENCPVRAPWFGGSGVGIYGDVVTLANTIVAGNPAPNPTDGDCRASEIHYVGYNLIGDGSCGAASSAQLTGDPLLGPLADYGGATPIQPLLAGSPAIDRIAFTPGFGCSGSNVAADQRGVPRPHPSDGHCDLGAVEYTGFPANPVVDNFNRVDGALGTDWTGDRGQASYRLVNGQVDVRGGGPLYWAPASFGLDQEAYLTLTTIDPDSGEHTLLLKVQGDPGDYTRGEIEVLYDSTAHAVKVETLLPGRSGWTIYPDIPVRFEDGDQLGARVYANGDVQVFRNNLLLATVTLKRRDQQFFNQVGGMIGVWFDHAPKATFDSFGGGTIGVQTVR